MSLGVTPQETALPAPTHQRGPQVSWRQQGWAFFAEHGTHQALGSLTL